MRHNIVARNLIPALTVVVVLCSSLVISAGASNSGRSHECGYAYTQADKDENGTEQGNNNDTKAHGEDNDKCEDEDTSEGNGEGGDHGDGHIDVTQRAGERADERGGGGG
jgi:hypothetical protein